MKRTAIRTTTRDTLLELECPECAEPVRVARDELIEGAPVTCRHCSLEAELRKEFETFTHKERWFLVDPLAEGDEEEQRRA